ncbi:ArpU family phage packaging/lysis transcriptional regulator [Fredinandcohnia sp. 179-A 10B2 NHS]|uniref:ArpU family phage packaging/lysis transcriptional regulator n=1 Tax=Fredinandcohnia sp. 179-A 10B2 NHS TaxID=3235176 RepID=UPI0039A398CD
MIAQISLKTPEVNTKSTRRAVERELEEYRRYLLTLPYDFFPKITPSYSILPPANTNKFHSSTEDAAIERVEFERTRDKYMTKFHEAVNTLKQDERFIIVKRYMQQDIGYDPDIWTELGVGKTKYYDVKGKALLRLAFALKIEVYKTRNAVKS